MKDFIWEGEMDLKICDDLLEFYDTCTYLQKHEYSGKTHSRGKISTDIHCHTMLARNEPRLDAYLSKLTELFGSYFVEYPAAGQIDCHIDPMFNIQRYQPNEGYTVWHSERGHDKINSERCLVWMTFLSDNPDGGTEWYYQEKYVPAVKGKTVIWPAEWTHTHRGRVDKNLEKTIITGWLLTG
tara:strand:+ start:203 stop:751 length:549 start_codon:yes stop_codon:yes gene_type:complete